VLTLITSKPKKTVKMSLKNIIFAVILITSLFLNIKTYLINRDNAIEEAYYQTYNIMSDNNGQIIGLMQLNTAAEPIIGDSIVIFDNNKEWYLTVNDIKKYEQLAMGE